MSAVVTELPVCERVSARVGQFDWQVFRRKAAGAGLSTGEYAVAAISDMLGGGADVLAGPDSSQPEPRVPRIVNLPWLPGMGGQFDRAASAFGLTRSTAIARVVRAVAAGDLVVHRRRVLIEK